jgi:hypothetical protein
MELNFRCVAFRHKFKKSLINPCKHMIKTSDKMLFDQVPQSGYKFDNHNVAKSFMKSYSELSYRKSPDNMVSISLVPGLTRVFSRGNSAFQSINATLKIQKSQSNSPEQYFQCWTIKTQWCESVYWRAGHFYLRFFFCCEGFYHLQIEFFQSTIMFVCFLLQSLPASLGKLMHNEGDFHKIVWIGKNQKIGMRVLLQGMYRLHVFWLSNFLNIY